MGLFDSFSLPKLPTLGEIYNVLNPQEQQLQGLAGAINNAMDAAERGARDSALRDALNDRSLDAITRGEIQSLYDSGGDSNVLANYLSQAREGKGIFGVRRIAYNQQRIEVDQPGRMQLAAVNPQSAGSNVLPYTPAPPTTTASLIDTTTPAAR